MKSVLISIQPKWCELIASGQKTIEVRKTKPKLETPFKVYIYCTQGDALAMPCLNTPKYTIHRMHNGTLKGRRMTAEEREKSDHLFANGKVIGEFVCNEITVAECGSYCNIPINESQLSAWDLLDYANEKTVYGWHISDLVIYDKPKELSEFNFPHYRDCDIDCKKCKFGFPVEVTGGVEYDCDRRIKRPPQSWCYVESIESE